MTTQSISILVISDEDKDNEVIATVPTEVHALSDFSYLNSSCHTIGIVLAEDLEYYADLPETLRWAAYKAIQGWNDKNIALYRAHYPDLVKDHHQAIGDAVATWLQSAPPAAAATWHAARGA